MTHDIINPSSIIIHDELEPCIFCLSNDPHPVVYKSHCNCHPLLHINCIDEWYKLRPDTCPICLKQSIIIKMVGGTNICSLKKICKCIGMICCCTLCFSPIIILTILVTLFSSKQILGNLSNSTDVL